MSRSRPETAARRATGYGADQLRHAPGGRCGLLRAGNCGVLSRRRRNAMASSAKGRPIRIVVFIQENKTTDFYFPTLAAWGADVMSLGHLLPNAPDFD